MSAKYCVGIKFQIREPQASDLQKIMKFHEKVAQRLPTEQF